MARCGSERVVDGRVDVEQGLQLVDRGRLVGLGGQPVLHGLLEPLDLPAGPGVPGARVLLDHVPIVELLLEGVAATAAA